MCSTDKMSGIYRVFTCIMKHLCIYIANDDVMCGLRSL